MPPTALHEDSRKKDIAGEQGNAEYRSNLKRPGIALESDNDSLLL